MWKFSNYISIIIYFFLQKLGIIFKEKLILVYAFIINSLLKRKYIKMIYVYDTF